MFLKCTDGHGQEGRGAGRQAPSLLLSVESRRGQRRDTRGKLGLSFSPAQPALRPPGHPDSRPPAQKALPPTCQLSCCLDCVTQRFDQTGALCTDNCFKYQGFGVSLALGPLSVLCQKNYALNPYIFCSPP